MYSQTCQYSNMRKIIYQYGSDGGCQSDHTVCAELVNVWNFVNNTIIQIESGALQIIKHWVVLSTVRIKMRNYAGPQA